MEDAIPQISRFWSREPLERDRKTAENPNGHRNMEEGEKESGQWSSIGEEVYRHSRLLVESALFVPKRNDESQEAEYQQHDDARSRPRVGCTCPGQKYAM